MSLVLSSYHNVVNCIFHPLRGHTFCTHSQVRVRDTVVYCKFWNEIHVRSFLSQYVNQTKLKPSEAIGLSTSEISNVQFHFICCQAALGGKELHLPEKMIISCKFRGHIPLEALSSLVSQPEAKSHCSSAIERGGLRQRGILPPSVHSVVVRVWRLTIPDRIPTDCFQSQNLFPWDTPGNRVSMDKVAAVGFIADGLQFLRSN